MVDAPAISPRSILALVGVHPLQVGEHDCSVERMFVLDASVLNDLVRDLLLVITIEITAAPRARLAEHGNPLCR